MIDWALDQFSEGAIWALVVLGVIAVVVGVIEAARFLKKEFRLGGRSPLCPRKRTFGSRETDALRRMIQRA